MHGIDKKFVKITALENFDVPDLGGKALGFALTQSCINNSFA